jgi:Hypothetical glycosyl hydrolase family 15
VSPARNPSVASALIFDYKIPADRVVAAEKSAHVGYLWGASAPERPGGRARHDYYVAWAQGWCPGRGLRAEGKCPRGGPPSFPWLKAHHPNWILWKVNSRGVPTAPASSTWDPGPIVDFTNPAVQKYWMVHYIAPYLKAGFDGIAWDHTIAYNPYGAAGHFDPRHRFIRQYSGSTADMRWDRAQTRALGDLLQRARSIDPKVQFAQVAPFDCYYLPTAMLFLPLRYLDTVGDEEGYTWWGDPKPWITSSPGTYCNNRWLDKTTSYIRLQKAGKHLVLINAAPVHVYPYITDTNRKARAVLEWALANYLLVKYSHTYFWFGGNQQYGYPIFEQREDLADVGRATGDTRPYQGVYARWFTKGMALVNPSPFEPFTATLQRGEYEDLYGQYVNRVTMRPHSGLVLVTRH